MKKKTNEAFFLFFFLAVPLLAGYASSLLSGSSMGPTYSQFYNPGFFPPAWLFAPVWTVLYLMMGLSAYLIWRLKSDTKVPMIIFSAQLVLNLIWSPIFFGLHQYLWSFIDILLMLVFIILTVLSFNKKSKAAAYLMIPYLFWVSFATILNFVVFMTN